MKKDRQPSQNKKLRSQLGKTTALLRFLKPILSVSLLLAPLAVHAQTNCSLIWSPSASATGAAGESYRCYHATNLSLPPTNWTLIVTAPSTATNALIAVVPGVHFFALTFSNFWGESPPSNVAGPPAAPLPSTLRIERTP